MSRKTMALLVIAALALPVAALAAMVGQQEWLRSRVTILNVAVRGADPRDLLRGHYLTVAFAWNWESLPQPDADGRLPAGALCVVAIDAERQPRVRFVPRPSPDEPKPDGCRLLIPGWMLGSDTFVPGTIGTINGGIRLFVPETRAAELERLIRERPGALTVDLAVRADGHASIERLRIDGQVLGR
jgi:hypothetical protein